MDNYNIEMFYEEPSSDPRIIDSNKSTNECLGFVDIPKAEKEFKKIYNNYAKGLTKMLGK